jgi:hypothetical protein
MVQEPERPSTPEKQLLSLIEDPKAAAATQGKIKRRTFNLFSLDALRARISFLGEKFKAALTPKKFSLELKGVNRILSAAIVLLAAALVLTVTRSIEKLNRIPDFGLGTARPASEPLSTEDSIKKLMSYLDKVRARDIFRFGGVIKIQPQELVEEVQEPVAAAPSPAEELLNSLRLVGIGWTEEPDVMIENTSTKKVYFLKRGDWIDGRIQVNAIFEDRVIVSFDGKEAELR